MNLKKTRNSVRLRKTGKHTLFSVKTMPQPLNHTSLAFAVEVPHL